VWKRSYLKSRLKFIFLVKYHMKIPAIVKMTKAMMKGNAFLDVMGGDGAGVGDEVAADGVAVGVLSPVVPEPPVPQLLTGVWVAVGTGTVGFGATSPGDAVVLLVTGERGLCTVNELLSLMVTRSTVMSTRTGRRLP
jgi:hypothetical protein